MMHRVWWYLGEVSYCLSRSSVKFQGHPGQKKSPILTRIGRFRTVTPVWIHRWLWNDAQSLILYKRGVLLFFKVIHQISRSHRLKNWWFESNLSKITRLVAAIKSLRFTLLAAVRYLQTGGRSSSWASIRTRVKPLTVATIMVSSSQVKLWSCWNRC